MLRVSVLCFGINNTHMFASTHLTVSKGWLLLEAPLQIYIYIYIKRVNMKQTQNISF